MFSARHQKGKGSLCFAVLLSCCPTSGGKGHSYWAFLCGVSPDDKNTSECPQQVLPWAVRMKRDAVQSLPTRAVTCHGCYAGDSEGMEGAQGGHGASPAPSLPQRSGRVDSSTLRANMSQHGR